VRPTTEGASPSRQTTVEDLLELVTRLKANVPHARCEVGTGPLAPLAVALNDLAATLEARRTPMDEPFGLDALIAQSPIMMITYDLDERLRFINYTVPGLRPEALLGSPLAKFNTPEELEIIRGHVRRLVATGEPVGYEMRPRFSAGPEWYGVKLGPIRSGDQIVGFTMNLMDITDLKRTQAHLEQSNRELENFASVASHDLQEPLRKIQTFSERLKATSAAQLGPEGRDYLERMHSAATRMRRLIDDMLSFARISSRGRPFARVALADITQEVLGDLETTIEQAGGTVTVGELPVLEADPSQMRQLLQNLLSNALKFRRDGVPPVISVRASHTPDGRACELTVEDNGIGFDEKYLDRIFNVFQRLHGRGKYDGTGIGLAICRKIAERHGGAIHARSTPGAGARFIVTLPLKQPHPK
jgi:PAS domain S-box-containing protein